MTDSRTAPTPTPSSCADVYSRDSRCPTCKLTPGLCVCASLPRLRLPFRVLVLQHAEERFRQSNTGSLVRHIVADSRLVHWARKGHPFNPETLARPDESYSVLFPTPGATPLEPGGLHKSDGCTPVLVVLDATWKQARRMSRRIPRIRKLPFVSLADVTPPALGLRRPRRNDQLSTGEAVAGALQALGFEREGTILRDALERIASRILHIRGKHPRSDVLPPSSLDGRRSVLHTPGEEGCPARPTEHTNPDDQELPEPWHDVTG